MALVLQMALCSKIVAQRTPYSAMKENTCRRVASTLSTLEQEPAPHERTAARIDPPRAGNGDAGRQVRARAGSRLHERRAGAGATADAAARARCRGWAEHRRVRQRLSRLAARRLRPGAVASE